MSDSADALEALLHSIQSSAKYRNVSADLIRRLAQKELATRRTLKEAEKETRNKLHQIAGAYLDSKPHYADWLATLKGVQVFRCSGVQDKADVGNWEQGTEPIQNPKSKIQNPDAQHLTPEHLNTWIPEHLNPIMAHHASTRERLPFLSDFYATVLQNVPPIHSVVDVACGLNPLAIPWMPLEPGATYYAYDIYQDMMDFLNGFFPLVGVNGRAEVRDVVSAPPEQPVDLALVLKALPPLEQQDKTAGLRLLKSLRARHILVSFPTRSLGGRGKGMAENYERRFLEMIQGERWTVQRFEFANELCFLLT